MKIYIRELFPFLCIPIKFWNDYPGHFHINANCHKANLRRKCILHLSTTMYWVLKLEVIEESHSAWSSPKVMVTSQTINLFSKLAKYWAGYRYISFRVTRQDCFYGAEKPLIWLCGVAIRVMQSPPMDASRASQAKPAGLTIKISKNYLFKRRVKYLGHIIRVSPGTHYPEKVKIPITKTLRSLSRSTINTFGNWG